MSNFYLILKYFKYKSSNIQQQKLAMNKTSHISKQFMHKFIFLMETYFHEKVFY